MPSIVVIISFKNAEDLLKVLLLFIELFIELLLLSISEEFLFSNLLFFWSNISNDVCFLNLIDSDDNFEFNIFFLLCSR